MECVGAHAVRSICVPAELWEHAARRAQLPTGFRVHGRSAIELHLPAALIHGCTPGTLSEVRRRRGTGDGGRDGGIFEPHSPAASAISSSGTTLRCSATSRRSSASSSFPPPTRSRRSSTRSACSPPGISCAPSAVCSSHGSVIAWDAHAFSSCPSSSSFESPPSALLSITLRPDDSLDFWRDPRPSRAVHGFRPQPDSC